MAGKPYKLYYFDITALGEPVRFMLSYLGQPFEDIRVERADWPAMKPTKPYGRMPTLEMDGKVLHQSKAIVRYLAQPVGLAGESDSETLQINMIAETFDDFRMLLGAYFYDDIPVSKAAKKAPTLDEAAPFYLERLEAQAKANGGYFVNGKLSWADIYFAGISDYLSHMAESDNLYANYPNLQGIREKVFSIPKIAAYIAKRPKTPM